MKKNISSTTKNATPTATHYKTEWDFSDLYSSITDPKIEQDVAAIESAYTAFAKKYAKKTDYLTDETALLKALRDLEKLNKATASWKPVWYLYIIHDVDSSRSDIQIKRDLLENRLVTAVNQILFFEINLGKISADVQKRMLSVVTLAPFRYYLERIFITAKHNLSEAEERILNLESQPAHGMWVDAQKIFLNSHTVLFKGKQIPLSEALEIKANLPLKPRRALHDAIIKKCKEISFFAGAELNAIVTDKKIRDELRGYKKPYEATIQGYLNDQKSIEALVAAVTANFTISQKFYKLKAKFMKLPYLTNADLAVDLAASKKVIPFEKGVQIVNDAFHRADPEFATFLQNMLSNSRIDVFPRKGKRSGAYCASGENVPTSIMMNYTDSLNSVMTLAHEMGHALHSQYSKSQPSFYQDYPISIAEVASTFFENLIFDEVYETLSEKDKVFASFNRIQDDIQTIFRQIAFFNFEHELHLQIREKGGLSTEDIAALYKKHLSSYLGNAIKLEEADGHTFVYISHFRSFFYVYSYAYGQLISKALYATYKKDPTFIKKVKEFLSAGGSKSPDQIFLDIGIDTTKSSFFEAGLASIAEQIKQLEVLAKKNKLI